MKKIVKISYILRIVFFIIHFYFVFMLIESILNTKYVGILFLIVYLLYVIFSLIELMSKRKECKSDLIYNLMQIGLFIYLIVLSLRININGIFVGSSTEIYFCTNYGILSILLIFIYIYNKVEFRNKKSL